MVIMNPPFTKDTSNEGEKVGVSNPTFAAFSSSREEQQEMAKAAKRLLQGTSAHGNAGEASAFLVLADRKLKEGGTLAMVMPLSLMSGEAWEGSRKLLRKLYSNLILISIAGAGHNDMSFSADTGMAECLVIGRKSGENKNRAIFVVLNERPSSIMVGSSIAVQIERLKNGNIRKIEDGPVGGSPLHFGDNAIGYAIDAPLVEKGLWNLSHIKDGTLAQVAYQIATYGLIWLPGVMRNEAISVPISIVNEIGKIGPLHWDITGNSSSGGIRGPFIVERIENQSAPTYPVLWWHETKRERCMEFEADSEGILRQGKDTAEDKFAQDKAARIWSISSHRHFNKDFQFNSQATAMQFTSMKTIGGHAWPSIKLGNRDQEKALVLWANSTFGLLLHWWHANKQQSGRGRVVISALGSLPVLDVNKLSQTALSKAIAIFDDIKNKELQPINEIALDSVRAEIDSRLATEVLRFSPASVAPDGPLALLRKKLGLEPSIAGTKQIDK
jgi:hypothetical protein